MVYFTCKTCGYTLKKNSCAKHERKCYPLALTCVDCHKDFLGNDFAAHTSCVTEAKKYGVKGIVSQAPSTKGATKQELWTQAILSASKLTNLEPGQRFYLGIIKQYKNVPKKKTPFQNYARDVWKGSGWHLDVLDQVFDIVESEFQKIKVLPKGKSSSEAKVEGNEVNNDKVVNDNTESVVEGTTNIKSKAKKKKKAYKDEEAIKNGNGTFEEPVSPEDDSTNGKNKSKKKKKHKKSAEAEELIKDGKSLLEEPVSAENEPVSVKRKRKSKEKLNKVDENGSIDILDVPKKSKKTKHKKQEENAEETVENVNGQDESLAKDAAKKSKKKKLKLQDGEEYCVPRKKTKTSG